MTTEEKAKAYDEAKKRAKGLLNTNPPDTERLTIEIIFPELSESEDERVRKDLICEVQSWEGISQSKREKYVAWLEKQKEQKPAECLKPERDCWYVCIKDFYDGGKKQSSKGDLVQAKGGMYMMGRDDISEWFRKAYYDEIKPAEWSEEDEITIADLINYFEGDSLECSTEEMVRRIKSLRPQPHWKPTEEQMKHLKWCFSHGHTLQLPNQHVLESLYNELKKLM